jgi:regulator of protease activity HflC (stomatin/prohibitin superfamily)
MQSRIELARREEQLVAQQGANTRRQAEEAAEATRIQSEAEAAQRRRLGEAQADASRAMGVAAAAEAARLAAYPELSEATLLGLALKDLATNLPKVQSLVLTPDLIAPLLARLASSPAAAPAPARAAAAPSVDR